MKLLSWNVNGLSACIRKGFLKTALGSGADVICCQEIRSRCEIHTPGYHQFWNPAKRQGYAGTLTLTKRLPLSSSYGTGNKEVDGEGRVISLEYEEFYIINVYFPNTWGDPDRGDFRRRWEAALRDYLERLQKPVVICGDFNVGHKQIDIYPENQRNQRKYDACGDTAEHRQGFDELLALGYLDAFRVKYPNKKGSYTWWAPRDNNRAENRGSRLDYFLVTEELKSYIQEVRHLTDEPASDHCPISLVLKAVETEQAIPSARASKKWRKIDWAAIESEVEQMQTAIADAAFHRDWETVYKLQAKLTE